MKKDIKKAYRKNRASVTKETELLRNLVNSNDWCKVENRVLFIKDEYVTAITHMVICGVNIIKIVDNIETLVELSVRSTNTILEIAVIATKIINEFE